MGKSLSKSIDDLDKAIRENHEKKPKRKSCAELGQAAVMGKKPVIHEPVIVRRSFDQIESEPLSWLWPQRIALGAVSMIAGKEGLGKSQITYAIAANVTTGGKWPVDGSICPMGSVVFLTSEDFKGRTIKPRLEKAGAILSNCHLFEGVTTPGKDGISPINLRDNIESIVKDIISIGNVKLLVIDPITAFMGKLDNNKVTDIRELFYYLQNTAEFLNMAILLISHFNKSSTQAINQRVMGSGAYVQASRAVFNVVEDPKNPKDRRLLLTIKNNLSKLKNGYSYTFQSVPLDDSSPLGDENETSKIIWGNEFIDMTPDEAMMGNNDQGRKGVTGAREEAKRFLSSLLENGPVLASEIERECEEAGFARATIKRAKDELGIESAKIENRWIWKSINSSNTPDTQKVDTLDTLQAGRGFQPEKNAYFGQEYQPEQLIRLNENELQSTAKIDVLKDFKNKSMSSHEDEKALIIE